MGKGPSVRLLQSDPSARGMRARTARGTADLTSSLVPSSKSRQDHVNRNARRENGIQAEFSTRWHGNVIQVRIRAWVAMNRASIHRGLQAPPNGQCCHLRPVLDKAGSRVGCQAPPAAKYMAIALRPCTSIRRKPTGPKGRKWLRKRAAADQHRLPEAELHRRERSSRGGNNVLPRGVPPRSHRLSLPWNNPMRCRDRLMMRSREPRRKTLSASRRRISSISRK